MAAKILCNAAPGSSGTRAAVRLDASTRTVLHRWQRHNEEDAVTDGQDADSPARQVDARIAALADWRGEMLARVRKLIRDADPDVAEEVKWKKPSNGMRGVPVWEHAGIICTGETYKDKVKLTFAHGAALDDPAGLFNAGLDGGTRRAIDLHAGARIDATAFKALIRAAVALNVARVATRPVRARPRRKTG
jgi:hypothetical protein